MLSNKETWHRFTHEYERLIFSQLPHAECLLEIGVGADGNSYSIEALHKRFPTANIIGADILKPDVNWFKHKNISYVQFNQGDSVEVADFFADKQFDLIIDDASHQAVDQATCLVTGMHALISGGFYVVEDLHTTEIIASDTPCRILLAIEHLKRRGASAAEVDIIFSAIKMEYFNLAKLNFLFSVIEDVYFFRRATLPLLCFQDHCKSDKFDYINHFCKCAVPIYAYPDSLTAIVKKK